jgi:hypothetical protein
MLKVQAWTEGDFRTHLQRRLAYAKSYRKKYEETWSENERIYYNAVVNETQTPNITAEDLEALGTDDDLELSVRDVAINYVMRDVRYMHAQMSSNPPTVKIIPTSTDADDEERADAADIAARWAKEHYHAPEIVDQRNLKTLTKGTGYLRYSWDSTLGKILHFDENSGELLMSGDTRLYSPSTWKVWLDPDARCPDVTAIDGPKWFFEEIDMAYDEACMRFPDAAEELKKALSSSASSTNKFRFWTGDKEESRGGEDRVRVYFYAERGEAINGMQGRQAYMLEGGHILEFGKNEHPNARLPLDVLTDIDVEDEPYGKSIIEYLGPVQAMIQSLDANTLRNVAAHAVIRMYVDSNTTLSDDALSNDGLDIIQGDGAPPKFLDPPSQMADSWKLRDQLQQGSRDVSMINEAMLGQASRETSGFTTQLQVNQGNLGRRRIFNKFTLSTKNLYYNLLGLIIENWDEPRQIQVLGTERSFEVHTFRSTDLDGGWDIIAEYGQNFSLDPNTARDQVMQLFPLFEKIPGFDYRSLADVVRLNVMDNFVDHLTLAKRRQRKIFKQMIRQHEAMGSTAYIEPREMENHKDMLAYCREFVMTNEYDLLEPETKDLIDQHIKQRETMAADIEARAQQAAQPPQAPAPAGLPQQLGLPAAV